MKSIYSTALLIAVMCVMYGGMILGGIYIIDHNDSPSVFSSINNPWRGL